jgi:transcription elongation GreA/GreB family factor
MGFLMAKSLTRAEVIALASDLRDMLDKIESGELDATTAMRHRIEGAIAVLDVVLGRATQFRPAQPISNQ